MHQDDPVPARVRRQAQARLTVRVKISTKDAATPPLPTELRQGPCAYVIMEASSNLFIGSAHTLVYLADAAVERTETNEKGVDRLA